MDSKGIWRSVYSWTLKKSDRPPAGKKPESCLREKKEQIERDRKDGIDSYAAQRMTLNAFFENYISVRPLKDSTRTNYKYMYVLIDSLSLHFNLLLLQMGADFLCGDSMVFICVVFQ